MDERIFLFNQLVDTYKNNLKADPPVHIRRMWLAMNPMQLTMELKKWQLKKDQSL